VGFSICICVARLCLTKHAFHIILRHTQIHTHVRACTHTQAHTHTHTYTHTYTHKHTHTHKQANTHTHKQAKQRVGMDTQLSAEAASLSRIAARLCLTKHAFHIILRHTQIHTHVRACTHTHTQAHTHIHTHTHTSTHTNKQTHTHKQAKQRVGMDTQLSAEAASLSRIAAAKAVNGGNESNSCLEGKVVKNEWQTTKGRQDECGVVPADL